MQRQLIVIVIVTAVTGLLTACPAVEPDKPEPTPFATTPPPGGDCGRDWSTFDPDNVYVVAAHTGLGLRDSCVVFGLAEPRAFAARIFCPRGEWHGGSIDPDTGTLRYRGSQPTQLLRFAADRAVTSSPPCRFDGGEGFGADDELLATVDRRLLFDERHRVVAGDDVKGWQRDDGAVLDGYPIAFNDAGAVLMATNGEAPSAWRVEDRDGTTHATTLPQEMCAACAARSVRRDGDGFRVVSVVVGAGGGIHGWRVDADGSTHLVASYAECRFCDLSGPVLLPDDVVMVRRGNEIVRLLPDGVSIEVQFRAEDTDDLRPIDLVTGL